MTRKGSSISGTNKEALMKEQKMLKNKGRKTRLVKSGRIEWGRGTKQYYTLPWEVRGNGKFER